MADLTKAQLEQELAAAKEKLAQLESGKPAAKWPANLIITRSQLEALSEADQNEFRKKGGTVTEDPQETK